MGLSFLNQILNQKKREVATISFDDDGIDVPHYSFIKRLFGGKLKLIAEVKQASPSRGIISQSFSPVELAQHFESSGASCISVLTDEQFFKGSIVDLMSVKQAVQLPVLRKDFIIDPIQVKQTRHIGADVILLILDILSVNQANELIDLANQEGLEVLIEIHSNSALEKLSMIKNKPLVGINNRDLVTFDCDISRVLKMKEDINSMDSSIKLVAESGYFLPDEMQALEKQNINGVLIGEGLIKNKQLLEWFRREN